MPRLRSLPLAAAGLSILPMSLTGCTRSGTPEAPITAPLTPEQQAKTIQDNPHMSPEMKARMIQLNRDPHSLGGRPGSKPLSAK